MKIKFRKKNFLEGESAADGKSVPPPRTGKSAVSQVNSFF